MEEAYITTEHKWKARLNVHGGKQEHGQLLGNVFASCRGRLFGFTQHAVNTQQLNLHQTSVRGGFPTQADIEYAI
jgi:hypothetical protein